METIAVTSLRTLVGFVVLLILTRMLGKKQLSQMTFFTYITGIAMGNIAGDMVVHRDIKVIDGVVALVLWTLFTLGIEWVSLKSAHGRVLLDGEPAIVIKRGDIQRRAMKRSRLNMDDLSMLLRNKNIFSIKDVDYAILEPNGELSVLKNPGLESATKTDVQIPASPRLYLPTELIVDGQVVTKNLEEYNLTHDWLKQQLIAQGTEKIEDIYFAELQSDGTLFIDTY